MPPRRVPHRWYIPGRLYDLSFGGLLRAFRRSVAAEVEKSGALPWLDVCCGTGIQLRGLGPGWKGSAAVGLDLSPGMIRYAAARAPDRQFVRGDAAFLPFRSGTFRAVTVSFGLHDKSPAVRRAMLEEAGRVLAEGGKLVAIDFEIPWDGPSSVGALFTRAIDRTAGGDHYRNGRAFLRGGGLRAFLRECGWAEMNRRNVAAGSIGIVSSRPEPSARSAIS
jgi:ubiquinone/menaquinone biosynthesis C-methylase UbiE